MPKPENYPPFSAHFDANQVPTIMGVVGSAGTADTGGTAQPLPVGVRENGALYVYNLGPAGAVTVAGTDPTSFLPARLTDGTNFYNASGGGGGSGTTVISDGTQIANTIPGDAGFNSLIVANGIKTQSITLNSGTPNSPWYDCAAYAWIMLSTLTNTSATSVTFQTTTDPTQSIISSVGLQVPSQTLASPTTNSTTTSNYSGPVQGRYFRLSSGVAGTHSVTASLVLSTLPRQMISSGGQVALNGISSVNMFNGTLTTGTLAQVTSVSNLASGTIGGKAASGAIAVANPVQIAGTDAGGTIYSPLVTSSGALTVTGASAGTFVNVSTGTQQTLGTVGILNTGTLAEVTLIPTVTTVSNLTNGTVNAILNSGSISILNSGSVRMTIGTLTTGTLQNLVSGTINALGAGTITAGTLTNLATGTINALAAGTITTGTVSVTTGTLSPIPTIANTNFGTIGTTGASVFGTLAGGTSSGAGTEIFITSLSLTMPSTAGSQDISIGWGTNAGTFHAGTARLIRGNFPAGGGIQKTFSPPINSGTNAQLCYFQAGAGTANIDVTYFVTPSTL